MQSFMGKDFLLSTPSAVRLYHEFAENMPIADYHCHINPREIYEDKHFDNIFQVWLSGDHYKWRVMRSNGCSGRIHNRQSAGTRKIPKVC